jgi:hypothetical protein
MEDLPQNQITLAIPAFESRVYKAGIVGYRD